MMGTVIYSPGYRVTKEDIEGGDKAGKKPRYGRLSGRLQRHIDHALAIAGDHPAWINAFLSEMKQMFGDLVMNIMINTNLDTNFIDCEEYGYNGAYIHNRSLVLFRVWPYRLQFDFWPG